MDVCASFHIYELNKMQVRLNSHLVQPIVYQTNELLIKLVTAWAWMNHILYEKKIVSILLIKLYD